MEGAAEDLLGLIDGDPARVWDAGVTPMDPLSVTLQLGHNAALAMAGLALDARKIESGGGAVTSHMEVAAVLDRFYRELSDIGASLGQPLPAIEEFVSRRINMKDASTSLAVGSKPAKEGKEEWPAFSKFGRADIVAYGRNLISERLGEFGYRGSEFDVVECGMDKFFLVFSATEPMVFRRGAELIVPQSYDGLMDRSFQALFTVDFNNRPRDMRPLGRSLYRNLFASATSLGIKIDTDSHHRTLVTDSVDRPLNELRDGVSTAMTWLMGAKSDGTVFESKIPRIHNGKGFGFRLALELS